MSKALVFLPALALACLLAACSSKPPAPVVDRGRGADSYQSTPDGHYRVRSGDTLHGIAFHYGLDWRDIAAWNGIRSPWLIYPDQLLRLSAEPGSGRSEASGTESKAAPTGVTVSAGQRQPASATIKAAPAPSATTVTAEPNPAATAKPATTESAPARASTAPAGDPGKWLWPTNGRIVSNFKPNDPARKGVDIGGSVGQPVVASASGEVVYSGSGLIGYGELIIIKHSDRMLSAYAHNSRRLVSEGQRVQAGSRIAEMGRNDRNKALLHFEIRVNGNPVDPLKYLPTK